MDGCDEEGDGVGRLRFNQRVEALDQDGIKRFGWFSGWVWTEERSAVFLGKKHYCSIFVLRINRDNWYIYTKKKKKKREDAVF